jgi:hypothetical protein
MFLFFFTGILHFCTLIDMIHLEISNAFGRSSHWVKPSTSGPYNTKENLNHKWEIKHEVTRVSIKLQMVLNLTSPCVLVKKVVSTNRRRRKGEWEVVCTWNCPDLDTSSQDDR